MIEIETETQLSPYRPDPNTIVNIPVEQLFLDPQNARLAWESDDDSQENLAQILWTEMDAGEVAWSIAENGFFPSEPLFVVIENPQETERKKQKFIAVEGNRRLASVLLLRNQDWRERIGATNLPDISETQRAELNSLPAIIYPDSKSLWTTIGFRHIKGIKPWNGFSKAQYVAKVHETYEIPLQKIADSIGDRHATVKRLYRGYTVLAQAESSGAYNREDSVRIRFAFSHLYTALDQREFQEFLGIDSQTLRRDPVPKSKLGELEELMIWLYGKKSEGIQPVVRTQNPDLNILRKVISNKGSLSALRSGYPLDRTYKIALGDKKLFRDALTSAKVELQNAKATVITGYREEEDLLEIIQDVYDLAVSIMREMEGMREESGAKQDTRRRRFAGRSR